MAGPPTAASSSGSTTPPTASTLTAAGIQHNANGSDPSALLPTASLTNGHSSSNGTSNGTSKPQESPLDASLTTYSLTPTPRPVPAPNDPDVLAQRICTDHMITATWKLGSGWSAPSLVPYGPLQIMPNASVLHYATECFEGMKLYRGIEDGKLRLFRPSKNCARMRKSAARIALPDFDPQELEKMIVDLCRVDGKRWLPDSPEGRGKFLYVRPTMIGNDAALGVQRPKEALLYVILAVFPDMTKSIPQAVPTAPPGFIGDLDAEKEKEPKKSSGLRLLASSEDTIRAWPGGFGYAKLGANYGPSLVAQGEARARGFDQVLWLFGPEGVVTEAGASNFFVVWRTPEGKLQLITAPLEERIILEGITRASILELARERLAKKTSSASSEGESVEVVERSFTMDEIVAAQKEGRLVEAFAAGTAFFVAPVSTIHFRGQDLEVPMSEGESGLYAKRIKQWLVDIMYGHVEHEWGVVVEEK
jgi:branched-chain amino acid aminotransferase